MIDYDKIRSRNTALGKIYRVPEKVCPNYAALDRLLKTREEAEWADAMSGGPVLTDADHWKRRYQELTKEVIHLRQQVERLSSVIKKLAKEGGEGDVL